MLPLSAASPAHTGGRWPSDHAVPDAELVERAVRGDALAFGALYERYRSRLLRFATARLKDSEEARDVVQETFLEALHGLHRYRGDAPLWSWLAGIAHHRICARYRARRPTPASEDLLEVASPSGSLDDALDARRSLERCAAVTRRLPSVQQRMFQLRYGENHSIELIARTVRRSSASVKVGLFRTRRKLLNEVPELTGGAGA